MQFKKFLLTITKKNAAESPHQNASHLAAEQSPLFRQHESPYDRA